MTHTGRLHRESPSLQSIPIRTSKVSAEYRNAEARAAVAAAQIELHIALSKLRDAEAEVTAKRSAVRAAEAAFDVAWGGGEVA